MNKETLDKAFNRAINGGTAGFIAMSGQVVSMMWLRTIVNHQYRNGGTFKSTARLLYNEGGIVRFYRGLPFALLQAPLSRFGDTAMNAGVAVLLEDTNLSLAEKTFAGSCGAGLWRIGIMPIDTLKSSLQVNGANGIGIIRDRMKVEGLRTFYNGSMASGLSTVMGHFPWFYTYNFLNEKFPRKDFENSPKYKQLLRSAGIGFASSSISDTVSNIFRVVKIMRQTNTESTGYYRLVKDTLKNESIFSMMTRGLKTKILTNGIQGMIFVVLFDLLKKS